MKNRKSQILVILGIAIAAVSQLFNHFQNLPDYLYGGLMGLAFGISILGLVFIAKSKKRVSI